MGTLNITGLGAFEHFAARSKEIVELGEILVMMWLRPTMRKLPSPKQLWQWQDIFLQTDCWLCDRATPTCLCPSCTTRLDACALSSNQQLQELQQYPADDISRVLAWASYGDSVKRLLMQLKYENRPEIAELMGQRLAQTWLKHQLPRLPIVPIPLHADRQADRGYNQAALIAQGFAKFVGVRVIEDLLIRNKATTAQYGLRLSDREKNLQGAFQVNPRSAQSLLQKHRQVVLIDDIYTTGATVASARQILRQANIQVWGVAVVAR